MAQSAAAPTDGSIIVFGSSDPTNNTVGEITSLSTSAERAAIDVTHMGSLSREAVVGITDAGTVDVEFNFIGPSTSQALLTTDIMKAQATLNAAAGFTSVRITWNCQAVANTTWTFDAFVTNFSVSGSEGEKLTGSATLKISTDGGQTPITIA